MNEFQGKNAARRKNLGMNEVASALEEHEEEDGVAGEGSM